MKPYIEYNNEKYEFEASLPLEREFNKAIQDRYKSMINSGDLTEEDIEEIKEIENFVKNNKDLTEKELKENHKDIYSKMIKYSPKMQSLILIDIYEEYCFKMLNIKYGIDKETWNKMIQQYYDEYCETLEEVDELFNKIIEIVFIEKQEKKKIKQKKTLAWIKN